ncbi:hypothetical protein Drorol1_Dr00001628, partial [Drosera rotundifolia]
WSVYGSLGLLGSVTASMSQQPHFMQYSRSLSLLRTPPTAAGHRRRPHPRHRQTSPLLAPLLPPPQPPFSPLLLIFFSKLAVEFPVLRTPPAAAGHPLSPRRYHRTSPLPAPLPTDIPCHRVTVVPASVVVLLYAAAAGGFMPSQATQAPDSSFSFSKPREAQGLTPLTVKQIGEAQSSASERQLHHRRS